MPPPPRQGRSCQEVWPSSRSRADVPAEHLDAVIELADECPGECIYIEVE